MSMAKLKVSPKKYGKYPKWLYCTHCGVWIPSDWVIEYDVKGNPICPRCSRRLRIRPKYYGRRRNND
jgi:NAD-dependent SIR2 family protein deacetylase